MFRGIITKAKRKLHLHQSGALKQCKPGKHISPTTLGRCGDTDCGKEICDNCQIEAPNSNLYCLNCFTTKPALQQTLITVDEDDDDDMFSFDNGSRDSSAAAGSFKKVGVTLDKNTG